MKNNLFAVAPCTAGVRGPGRRTATLLVVLSVLATANLCLHADSPPDPTITSSVLLTWPEDTADELIVVAADSLAGPWTPWHEPCYKHDGKLCLATPSTAAQQYFKLVPGTQFADDFHAAKPPFSGKLPWTPGFYESTDASRWEITNTNGTLRIQTLMPPVDGRLPIRRPGPQMDVSDFWAAVDIRDFAGTGVGDSRPQQVAIAARMSGAPGDPWPGNRNGYLAALNPNRNGLNQARLSLWTGYAGTTGALFTFRPEHPYRLIFSGEGQRLSVDLIDLQTQQPAVTPLVVTNWNFSRGDMGVYIQTLVGNSFNVTLDNFFATGTKP